MNGARKPYFERVNQDTERQLSYVLTHKWFLNIKQKTNKQTKNTTAYKPQSQRT